MSLGSKEDFFRFYGKVLVGDGCWEWQGWRRNAKGYGGLHTDGRTWLAHRLSWTLWNGPIPEGKSVLHQCDNPPCVRPDHLWLGDQFDNMGDAVQKGRSRRFKIIHCAQGHEFSDENTRWSQGQRVCIVCARRRGRISEAKRRQRLRDG